MNTNKKMIAVVAVMYITVVACWVAIRVIKAKQVIKDIKAREK